MQTKVKMLLYLFTAKGIRQSYPHCFQLTVKIQNPGVYNKSEPNVIAGGNNKMIWVYQNKPF
jgi:hypothetical protein